MKRYLILLKVIMICLVLSTAVYAGITITGPGNGYGTIKWLSSTGGITLESCTVWSLGSCNVAVSQDSVNGNVIMADAGTNSYFSGWSGATGNIGACSNSTRTCNITGSTAAGGPHAVNSRFNTCTFTLSSQTASFPWTGGAGNVTITAADNSCNWTAVENLDWVTITSGGSGTGTGALSYSLSTNSTTSSRTGALSIGGANFTISQDAYIGKIRVEPGTVNFGTIRTAAASQLDVKISNVGTTSLVINSLEITGTDAQEFSKAGSCSSIAAGNFCAVKVVLIPQSSGAKTADLEITSNDPAYPVYEVPLNATASASAAANISVDPSEIAFNFIDLEFPSTETIRVSNNGTGSLIINSVNLRGLNATEFSANNSCTVINPGSYCNFNVTGSYSSNVSKSAFAVISSNAQNAPKLELPVTASTAQCSGDMTLSDTSMTIPYGGANGTIEVTATGENTCAWTALGRDAWISLNTSGNTINYTVFSNTADSLRMGTVNAAGHSLAIIQHGSADNTTFDDIDGNNFADYINAIYSNGITVGCVLDTSFCPDDYVTRGQMAAFIVRALFGEDFYYSQTPYFTDVPSINAYFKYVQRLKDDGITALSGTYDIDSYVTRGQMAAFIIRALYGEGFSYTTIPYFTDVPLTNVYFEYVQKMKETGITAVSEIYNVDSYVTRGQMSAFISRSLLGME